MSMKKQIVLLETPPVIQGGKPERFVVDGFTCPECRGNKTVLRQDFDDADVDVRGWGKTVCPVCGGTGEVEAVVTVHWQASGGRSEV